MTPFDSHLRTLILSMDGNFKLNNLEKKNDPDDWPLWDGRGILRAREALESHMKEFINIKVEVGILVFGAYKYAH